MNRFDPSILEKLAQDFRALHILGRPLVLTNVWGPPTVSLGLNYPQTKAIATASFAIATVAGFEDDELTFEDNLYAVKRIARRLAKEGKASKIL
jgi:2-methylisocitrate lyase-like PEP mutase family enzyme